MNSKQVIVAAAFALVGSAGFAQTLQLQHFGENQTPTTTREAVRNEVIRSRANGQALVPSEVDVAALLPKAPVGGVTRAEVRAEVLKARADGSLARQQELDIAGGSVVASTRTREEVRAEAIAQTRAGQAARVQAGH